MFDLGASYLRQHKLEEAEKLLLQALQGYEKNIQPDKLIDISYRLMLDLINSLAELYREGRKFRKAEELYQVEIDGYKNALGHDNEKILSSMHSLGGFYMEQGKMVEAEKMFQLAVDGFRKALGPDNKETLSRMRDLCNLRKELWKLKASQADIAPMGGDGSPKAVPTPDTLVTQKNSGMEEASLSGSGGDDHYSERRHESGKVAEKKI
ncbi:conserved hypothetical protein [Aspergillus udagawae]|uniref:Uncharacterized protein n=1 Tax=Aspergillus udagawae TaxID=91492 RepID=A0A8H3XRF6_9EURO|nr:conserved hypothetical protein [Aspergillus udagawae]